MADTHSPAAPAPGDRSVPSPERSVVRDAMMRFTILSLVGLVVLTLISLPVANWIAQSVADREARLRTSSFARNIAGPLMDEAVRQDALGTTLAATVSNRLKDASIVHAVLWDVDGRIIWAEDPALIGTRETLDPEVQQLFDSLGAWSTFSRQAHAGGDVEGVVLEVYAGALDAAGRPFVLEWYWPTSQLAGTQRHILERMLPLTFGSLLLLHLLVLPLTLSTARRVESERARLTRHALAVQDIERRRLSDDLHDGVVQDLSGIGYVLPAVARELPPGSPARALLDQVAAAMQRDVTALREMIADIRPVDLSGSGFGEALEALAGRARDQGIETSVIVQGDVDLLGPGARTLVHRAVREGLRNVTRHSGGTHADVKVDIAPPLVRVTVQDDGRGPSAASDADRSEDDHFGLRILAEAVGELGGRLELREHPGGGAELVVTFRLDRIQP